MIDTLLKVFYNSLHSIKKSQITIISMNQWMRRKLRHATRKLEPQGAAENIRMLTERLRGCKTKAEVKAKKIEMLSDAACNAIEMGVSIPVFKEHWEIIASLIDIWALVSLAIRLRPRFIWLCLIPTPLRIPTPQVEMVQPLAGRPPPPVAIFVPIPHKLEMGSCARSDLLADSAYLI